jgi:hypothetical protein
MPGPHPGDGSPEVAERWLITTFDFEEENEAAAAPATIAAKAKTLMASFIVGYLSTETIDTKEWLTNTKDTRPHFSPSPAISVSSISSRSFDY